MLGDAATDSDRLVRVTEFAFPDSSADPSLSGLDTMMNVGGRSTGFCPFGFYGNDSHILANQHIDGEEHCEPCP